MVLSSWLGVVPRDGDGRVAVSISTCDSPRPFIRTQRSVEYAPHIPLVAIADEGTNKQEIPIGDCA